MKHPRTLVFILLIIFVIFLVMYINNNHTTIKNPVISPMEKEMNENLKKRKMIDCKSTCKQEICNDYVKQQIQYDLCKECAKEFKCYDPYKRKCVFCLNFQSCEKMYGCGDTKPINPANNYCQKCWGEVIY